MSIFNTYADYAYIQPTHFIMTVFYPGPSENRTKTFARLSRKQKETLHRRLRILKLLIARREPFSMYRIHKILPEVNTSEIDREIGARNDNLAFAQVRKEVKNLEEQGLVKLSGGERGSMLVQPTRKGFYVTLLRGYLTEDEATGYVASESKSLAAAIDIIKAVRYREPSPLRVVLGGLPRPGGADLLFGSTVIEDQFDPYPTFDELAVVKLVGLVTSKEVSLENLQNRIGLLDTEKRAAWKRAAAQVTASLKVHVETLKVVERVAEQA